MILEMLSYLETQRAINQLESSGINCQAIVINQLIANQQTDDFWKKRAKLQQQVFEKVKLDFSFVYVFALPLKSEDIKGINVLYGLFNAEL